MRPIALLGVLAFLAVLLGCILFFPKWIVGRAELALRVPLVEQQLAEQQLKVEELRRRAESDRLKAENDLRSILLQAVGGLFLLAGSSVAWLQLRLGRQQLEMGQAQIQNSLNASQQELRLTREGQITERFTRAIDQLGNQNVDVRIGGIYALERLARESTIDRGPIVEILAAYVRNHSPWKPGSEIGEGNGSTVKESELPPLSVRAPDVQVVMTVLGRRQAVDKEQPIGLGEVDLRRAFLGDASLERVWLQKAHLDGSILTGAHLEKEHFWTVPT